MGRGDGHDFAVEFVEDDGTLVDWKNSGAVFDNHDPAIGPQIGFGRYIAGLDGEKW